MGRITSLGWTASFDWLTFLRAKPAAAQFLKLVLGVGLAAGLLAGVVAPAVALQAKQGDFTLPDFHFRSGETLPQLRLHYTTLGTPKEDASGRTSTRC